MYKSNFIAVCMVFCLAGLCACINNGGKHNGENMSAVTEGDTLSYSDSDISLFDSIDGQDGVRRTVSGLRYKVLVEGSGNKPTEDDSILVGYRGFHADGSLFWENEREEFVLNGTIKGFCEGVGMMPVGSKYVLYIPSALGYGHNGIAELIAPDEPLIYEVTLIDIMDGGSSE